MTDSDLYYWLVLDIDGVMNSERTACLYDDNHLGWPPRFLYKGDDDGCYEGYTVDHCRFDPVAVRILRRMVEKHDARIVISSTWRQYAKLQDFHVMFDLYGWDTRQVILDMTPVGKGHSGNPLAHSYRSRGLEIEFWRQKNEHRIKDYIILDDSHDMTGPQIDGGHFRPVNPFVGLSEKELRDVNERWKNK